MPHLDAHTQPQTSCGSRDGAPALSRELAGRLPDRSRLASRRTHWSVPAAATKALARLETRLHPGCNLGDGGGRPRHCVGARGHVAYYRMTCIPASFARLAGNPLPRETQEVFITRVSGPAGARMANADDDRSGTQRCEECRRCCSTPEASVRVGWLLPRTTRSASAQCRAGACGREQPCDVTPGD